jgi:hypothetical protein
MKALRPSTKLKQNAFFALYVIVLLVLLWYLWPSTFGIGGGGWWVCLDYVSKGTLYGGQPYCAQGPVIYYVGYAFDEAFGWIHTDLPLAILSIASNAIIFIITKKILRREGLYHPYLYPLLYALMVYRFMSDVTSMLSSAFFIVGFWLFYGYEGRYRLWGSGSAFTLAIFTKYMAALPIAITIAYVVFFREGIRFKGSKNGTRAFVDPERFRIKDAAAVGTFFLLMFLFMNLYFPNLREYTLEGHSDQVKGNMMSAISYQIEKRSLNSVATVIIFITLGYLMIKGLFDARKLVFPLTQITLPIIGLMFIRVGNVLDTKIGTHYMLPVYPLLLVTYMAVWYRSRKVFTLLVLVTMIYPSIFGSPLLEASRMWFEEKKAASIAAIQYGLHFIPPQQGYVLTEGNAGYEKIFKDYGTPISLDKVVVINNDSHRKVSYRRHMDAHTK